KTKTPDLSKHAWSYSTRSVDYENWAKLIARRVIDPGKAGNQSAGVARQYLGTFSPRSQLEALRATGCPSMW
ncbi:hypothetical protein M1N84_02425, partial [Dehalococcoidia bacterium]|nr:hypothetical protein [Dehalococcoidia bacterium]